MPSKERLAKMKRKKNRQSTTTTTSPLKDGNISSGFALDMCSDGVSVDF
jgi:hypothetical protein